MLVLRAQFGVSRLGRSEYNHAIAETAHRMIPGSELYDLFPGDLDIDLVPPEDWAPKEAEMAAVFVAFLKRAQAKAA
jgi:hypothetical protein